MKQANELSAWPFTLEKEGTASRPPKRLGAKWGPCFVLRQFWRTGRRSRNMSRLNLIDRWLSSSKAYVITSMLVLYALRQNGIKRVQSVLSSPKFRTVFRMVQTRRSSALNGVDTDNKSDRPEPPSKQVKVSKGSVRQNSYGEFIISIMQEPSSNSPHSLMPLQMKPRFEIALTVLGKLEHMYHGLEDWKMQSQMLPP